MVIKLHSQEETAIQSYFNHKRKLPFNLMRLITTGDAIEFFQAFFLITRNGHSTIFFYHPQTAIQPLLTHHWQVSKSF